MARKAGIFIAGLVVGALLMGILVYLALPGMMFKVHRSNLDFESTVTSIENAAGSHKWKVPKVYDIQASLVSAGHKDMTRLKIVSLCQREYAYRLLQTDENKFVSAIMPCRAAVYEATDGAVYISEHQYRPAGQPLRRRYRRGAGDYLRRAGEDVLPSLCRVSPGYALNRHISPTIGKVYFRELVRMETGFAPIHLSPGTGGMSMPFHPPR